ncbi:MAG: DUF4476 domain-containing protein [Prevotella sp.]|nr:DUF4476 domain-containing protein [Prevotella sp.]
MASPEGFSNSQVYESHTIGIFLSSLGIYSTPSHKKSILLQAKQNNKNVSVNDLEPSKTVTIMKRNELMALIATTILMFAVCMSASAKGKRNVERGMTKQEVIAILGEPKLTSFDMYGDKWEYAKYNNLFGDSKYITVFFDRNGKVVQYDTRIIEPNSQTSNVQQPQHPTPPIYDGRCDPDGRMDYGHCLDDASFSKLYNKVKKASFDDNKFDLIEVASLGCYYSCAQVVRIMKIFSFDDSKMKVLSMMAPRIVDLQNATDIYRIFTFDSDKEKAANILRNCR